MADFGTINEFRKTTELRKINEDPTYLSFFFLFNFEDNEHSPLLSGAAEEHLRNVVRDPNRADLLARFVKLLRKINRELPWFWQSLSGLEATKQYGGMEEPWWGAEKPKLEIECLENVELTAFALIDLYKRAVYDFNRWVKVIPTNLCEFEVFVFVTEVRRIQQSNEDGLKNSKGKNTSNTEIKDKKKTTGNSRKAPDEIEANKSLSVDAKPIIKTKLGHCHFDIESTSEIFTDLSKSPEMATNKIGIFWQTNEQVKEKYGENLGANPDETPVLEKEPENQEDDNNPFDAVENKAKDLGNNLKERAEGAVENVTNRFDEIPGSNNGLENVHGSLLTGQLGQIADTLVESATGQLLLENVHGLNAGSSIQDAINTGSLNAIFNSAGQLFNSSDGSDSIDTISPSRIYENVVQRPDGPIKTKVHDSATDSSPDGNLNQNVYG